MSSKKLPKIQYRIYITDGGTKFFLRDIIAYEKREHYFFDTDSRYAMRFHKWDAAMKYRERMIRDDYHPHIEQI